MCKMLGDNRCLPKNKRFRMQVRKIFTHIPMIIKSSEHQEMVSFSFLQFSSDEVETIFWESEENIKSCLNQNLIIRTLLENFLKLKTSLRQSFLKPILWAFENRIFLAFCKFLIDAVATIFRDTEANYSNQDLVLGSLSGNGFEATLGSKTNVLSV